MAWDKWSVIPREVTAWQFNSNFDKVLLSSGDDGGGNSIVFVQESEQSSPGHAPRRRSRCASRREV